MQKYVFASSKKKSVFKIVALLSMKKHKTRKNIKRHFFVSLEE